MVFWNRMNLFGDTLYYDDRRAMYICLCIYVHMRSRGQIVIFVSIQVNSISRDKRVFSTTVAILDLINYRYRFITAVRKSLNAEEHFFSVSRSAGICVTVCLFRNCGRPRDRWFTFVLCTYTRVHALFLNGVTHTVRALRGYSVVYNKTYLPTGLEIVWNSRADGTPSCNWFIVVAFQFHTATGFGYCGT